MQATCKRVRSPIGYRTVYDLRLLLPKNDLAVRSHGEVARGLFHFKHNGFAVAFAIGLICEYEQY
jgi:hypothetical protein